MGILFVLEIPAFAFTVSMRLKPSKLVPLAARNGDVVGRALRSNGLEINQGFQDVLNGLVANRARQRTRVVKERFGQPCEAGVPTIIITVV